MDAWAVGPAIGAGPGALDVLWPARRGVDLLARVTWEMSSRSHFVLETHGRRLSMRCREFAAVESLSIENRVGWESGVRSPSATFAEAQESGDAEFAPRRLHPDDKPYSLGRQLR